MSNRNYTATLEASGDLNEAQDALDAFIAGIKAKGHYFGSANLEPSGPEAVSAPALDAHENNVVTITMPNFVEEEGVIYYLQYSDDNWNTFQVISDGLGPNDCIDYEYNATRRFRVFAGSTWGSVAGPSSNPIP